MGSSRGVRRSRIPGKVLIHPKAMACIHGLLIPAIEGNIANGEGTGEQAGYNRGTEG
jgi:hypothetical protein